MNLYNEFEPFSKLVNSEIYNDFETFSKLVHENGNGNENGNVSTNKILGSLEIFAIKNVRITLLDNGVGLIVTLPKHSSSRESIPFMPAACLYNFT